MIPGKTLSYCLLLGGFTLTLFGAKPVVINDDGGWCWFQDERVLLLNGKLIVGSVASGYRDPQRRGDIDVTTYDLASGRSQRATLHQGGQPWLDDHNAPAFVKRHDGRLLAMYSRHGADEKIFYRISKRPLDSNEWGDERLFVPSPTSRVTYSNLHWLSREERIYNFFRGLDNSFKPSYAWSDDDGESWRTGSVFINVPAEFRHRPYVKYASNARTPFTSPTPTGILAISTTAFIMCSIGVESCINPMDRRSAISPRD